MKARIQHVWSGGFCARCRLPYVYEPQRPEPCRGPERIMHLTERPLQFTWSEWQTQVGHLSERTAETIARTKHGTTNEKADALVRNYTTWLTETCVWFGALSPARKADAMSLLLEEIHLLRVLAETVHKHVPAETVHDDRLEFRERYYDLLPALNVVRFCEHVLTKQADEQIKDVERIAERRKWLP